MDRRRFLEMLGMATVGGAVAYSFPSVIVPKNIDLIDLKSRAVGQSFIESTPLNSYDWFYEMYKKVSMSGIAEPNFIIGNKKFANYIGLECVPENSLIVINDNEIKIVNDLS